MGNVKRTLKREEFGTALPSFSIVDLLSDMERSALIVEEDRESLNRLAEILESEGFDVTTTETVAGALGLMAKNDFGIYLLDSSLPDENGIKLLRHINTSSPDSLKIMLTGKTDTDDVIDSLNNGADHFLLKPVQPEMLLQVLEEKLEERADEALEKVDVSVVIPTLNESETIGICIDTIYKVFSDNGIVGEIIVVDSSTDDTPQIAEELGAKVITPVRRGYGSAYLDGFKHVKGDYIVIGDGDNTYDFGEIPKLLEPLYNDEDDIVMGSRFKGDIKPGAMSWLHRHIGNPLLTGVLNVFFKAGISDAHCGLRAFTKEALETMRLRSRGMEFASEMIVVAARRGLRIGEVPITYYPREGESKLNSFQDGWRHLKFMLFYAPTYLYFYPGAFLSLAGLFFLFLTFFGINIGYIPGIHSMIVGGYLVIIGYQIIILGILATSYSNQVGILDTSGRVKNFLKKITLEKGVLGGIIMFITGMTMMFYLLSDWIRSGYRLLPVNGTDIIAFTLIILGLQTFFNSFLLSIISNNN